MNQLITRAPGKAKTKIFFIAIVKEIINSTSTKRIADKNVINFSETTMGVLNTCTALMALKWNKYHLCVKMHVSGALIIIKDGDSPNKAKVQSDIEGSGSFKQDGRRAGVSVAPLHP